MEGVKQVSAARKSSAETEQGATQLWIRVMKNHRIQQSLTIPCSRSDPGEALQEGCHQLDISRPVWLDKHDRDWNAFGQVRFIPSDFMDEVNFDRLEIEFIDPNAKKKKSADPRNQ